DRAVRWWDALFYATFALVVTSSVRRPGVLLVFSYLVVPVAISTLLVRAIAARLLLGWAVGAADSAAGLLAAYAWDLPTGASVVATFGVAIAAVATGLGLRALVAEVRRRGAGALRPLIVGVAALVGLAGPLLIALPR